MIMDKNLSKMFSSTYFNGKFVWPSFTGPYKFSTFYGSVVPTLMVWPSETVRFDSVVNRRVGVRSEWVSGLH